MIIRTDPLLVHYPVRIREVTIGVILFLTFMFYFFPRFLGEGERTNFTIVDEIETFDIPQTEQIKIPEPPARPSVPVASEDEFFDEDITIEDTDFDDFEDWDTPPPPSEGPNVKFIPYDKPPKPTLPIRPIYPEIAQEAGIEGTVVVQVFVDDKGRVKDTVILKGIPNTGLNEAASTAIRAVRFRPARQRERAVGVWISIPVNFRLKS
jgi:protein TonB